MCINRISGVTVNHKSRDMYDVHRIALLCLYYLPPVSAQCYVFHILWSHNAPRVYASESGLQNLLRAKAIHNSGVPSNKL